MALRLPVSKIYWRHMSPTPCYMLLKGDPTVPQLRNSLLVDLPSLDCLKRLLESHFYRKASLESIHCFLSLVLCLKIPFTLACFYLVFYFSILWIFFPRDALALATCGGGYTVVALVKNDWTNLYDSHSLHLHLCSAPAHALRSIAVSLASYDCKIVSQQFIPRAFCRRSRLAPLPHHPSLHSNQSISDTDWVLALTDLSRLIRREENHCIQLIYSTLLMEMYLYSDEKNGVKKRCLTQHG